MGDHSRVSDADRDRAASAAANSVRSGEADRLERWYRRLLALYPTRYRGVHEEEMLAVLMTAAPEGRPWPGLAEAADLIVGAVRVWCQPSRGGTTVPTWRGAVALTSAGAVLGLLAGIAFAALNPPLLTSRTLVLVDRQNEPPLHPRALPKWFRHNPRPLGFSRSQAQALEYADAVGLTGLFAASGPVLVHALPSIRPAISLQTLGSRIHVRDWLSAPESVPRNVLMISAQGSTAAQAERTANAVAESYIAWRSELGYCVRQHCFVGWRDELGYRKPVTDPKVLTPATTASRSPLAHTLVTSAGLGALIGAVGASGLGALIVGIGTMRFSRSGRRLRMT